MGSEMCIRDRNGFLSISDFCSMSDDDGENDPNSELRRDSVYICPISSTESSSGSDNSHHVDVFSGRAPFRHEGVTQTRIRNSHACSC